MKRKKEPKEQGFLESNLMASRRKKIRVAIKRILRQHGFPPDLQDDAVKTVILQAEALAADFQKERACHETYT